MFTSYKPQQFTRYPSTIVPDLSAGFDTPQATIQLLDASDSASVTVTATGPNTAKKFQFNFKLPKGTPGQPGADGLTPIIDPVTKHWVIGTTDTGVTAQGTLNGTALEITQAQNFLVQLNGNNVPVGLLTDKGNYYPIQKKTLDIDTFAKTMVLNLTQYIIADGSQEFKPPWTLYFAAGADGLSAYDVWLQQGNQGTQQDFFQSLRGQTYRYAFTADDVIDDALNIKTNGCPVSISDDQDVTYPLQFGSYTVTGTQTVINMSVNLSAIGKPVSGTWYVNFAAGAEGSGGEGNGITARTYTITEVDADNLVTFPSGLCPAILVTNNDNVYPVEKDTISYSDGVFTLDLSTYIAYDNVASFTGPWTVYGAGAGTSIQSGTATDVIQQTKFQVFPTLSDITAGTVDEVTGLTYTDTVVAANATQWVQVRTSYKQQDCDVTIDWGDGTVQSVANGDFKATITTYWQSDGQLTFLFPHTYTSQARFIVTISGNDYFGLQLHKTDSNTTCLSRVFDVDLPVARNLVNFAGMCTNAKKLLKVHMPTTLDLFSHCTNASRLFANCTNLVSATGFNTKFCYGRYVNELFSGCTSLTTCDFKLPSSTVKLKGLTSVFQNCKSLVADINDLLPETGFQGKQVTLEKTFYGCSSITGTIPSNILWNDTAATFIGTGCFTGCSDEIRAQAPVSWGGTADIVIPTVLSSTQTAALVQTKVAQAVQDLGGSTGSTLAQGYGSVVGGYGVRVVAYDNDAYKLTVQTLDTEDIDWTRLVAGSTVRISATQLLDYSDASDTLYGQSTISSVDTTNSYVYVTQWHDPIGSDSVITYRDPSSDIEANIGYVVLRVVDPDRKDSAVSLGDKNFVTGSRATGIGSWNVAAGTVSTAIGNSNYILGTDATGLGVYNKVAAMDAVAIGSSNTISDSATASIVIGQTNQIQGFANTVIGSGNHPKGISGIYIGNQHQGSEYGGVSIGTGNKVSGHMAVAVGGRLDNQAKQAVVIGNYGQLLDYAQNKAAVAFASGTHEQKAFPLIVRGYKAVLNPLFNSDSITDSTQLTAPNPKASTGQTKYNSQPAYSVQYAGRLVGTTQNISSVGTVSLDHDMYSRWVLTGTGDVTLQLQNWLDGDQGQIVVNTSKQAITFPAAWVSDGADIVTSPGQYVLNIAVIGDVVYCKVVYPVVAASGTSTNSAAQCCVVQSVNTQNMTVTVRKVTVDQNGVGTYTDEVVTARYGFTMEA